MKRVFCVISAVLLLCFSAPCTALASELSLSAQAYVLYCADTKEVLLSRSGDSPMGMASTTKIMTSLLALEYAAECDKVVEFTEDMIAEGSSMYLKVGDKVHLSDLATGMMTVSGNDAANAAAVAIGGSLEGFADIMNSRAKSIGMENTNFVTPSGLSDTDHYSTACDMALLMAEAMKNEKFKELTALKTAQVDFVYPEGQQVTYTNHNRLLSMYEYCIGGKTGYTKSTGRCLVTCAEYEGLRLIAVTLNDRNDWNDHIALYEYGFEHYAKVAVGEKSNYYSVSVAGAAKDSIKASASKSDSCVIDREDAELVHRQVYLAPVVFAPVEKGDVLGREVFTLNGKVILSTDIVAETSAESEKEFSFFEFFRNLFR